MNSVEVSNFQIALYGWSVIRGIGSICGCRAIKLYTGTKDAVPGIFCFLNWETWVAFAVMKLNFNYITEQFTMIFFQLVLFS